MFPYNTDKTFEEKLSFLKAYPETSLFTVIEEQEGTKRIHVQDFQRRRRALEAFRWCVNKAGFKGTCRIALIYMGRVMAIWHVQPNADNAPLVPDAAPVGDDNPYPPYTPGALADDTIASYEHTIAALQAQLAEAQAALMEAQGMISAMTFYGWRNADGREAVYHLTMSADDFKAKKAIIEAADHALTQVADGRCPDAAGNRVAGL